MARHTRKIAAMVSECGGALVLSLLLLLLVEDTGGQGRVGVGLGVWMVWHKTSYTSALGHCMLKLTTQPNNWRTAAAQSQMVQLESVVMCKTGGLQLERDTRRREATTMVLWSCTQVWFELVKQVPLARF